MEDSFRVWRQRRDERGAEVGLPELYELFAVARGVRVDDLTGTERNSLLALALPVLEPGFEILPNSDRDESEPIELVPYDERWPQRFADWHAAVHGVLAQTAVRVDHIGSTAVPGMYAKPVIDIQVSVPDVRDENAYVAAIESVGIQLRSRDDVHRFFRPFAGRARDVQVHVCGAHRAWERRNLLFRDYLRADPTARSDYLDAKVRAAERWRYDRIVYADAKTEVIEVLLGRAAIWASATGWSVASIDR